MKRANKYGTFLGYCLLFILLNACRNENNLKQQENISKKILKPEATYNDTLMVYPPCVVFYEPDSIQKEKLKAIMDRRIFDGTMHEYYFQQKNAKHFLKTNYHKLKLYNTDHSRFLLFEGYRRTYLLNLDKYESNGMFVFNGKKKPVLIDMTNVETQVSDYFK